MTRFQLISTDGLVNLSVMTDLIDYKAGAANFTVMEVSNNLSSETALASQVKNYLYQLPNKTLTIEALQTYCAANYLQMTALEMSVGDERPYVTEITLAAPRGLAGTVDSATKVTVGWTKSSGATGYIVERATNVSFTTGLVAFTVGDVATYQVTGLTTATQYWFRVRATAPYATTSANSSSITKTTS